MLFDWFTVAAQILNFAILVLLLKKFLYKPILDAVDAREEKISRSLAEAAEKEARAELNKQEYQKKIEEFNRLYNGKMSEAIKEASEKKAQLLEAARAEAAQLRERMLESFDSEKKSIANEIIMRTRDEVFSISRKVLKDLSGVTLEEQMIEVFLQKINNLSPEEKKRLVLNVNSPDHFFVVSTSFEIPDTLKFRIENSIRQLVSEIISDRRKSGIRVEFGQSPSVLCGIEMIAGGYKVAWSIADYLGCVENTIKEDS